MRPFGMGRPGERACCVLAALLSVSCVTGQIGEPGDDDDVSPPDASAPGPDARRPPPQPDAAAPPPDAPLPDAAACVQGDLNVVDPGSGHCYMYFGSAVPWDIALAACASLEPAAHLATVTSAEENAVLAELGPPDDQDIWMGGTDAVTEMDWAWITAEPMDYLNWRDGEPNDASGEDCMVMEVDVGGSWDDRGCEQTYTYYCER